MKLDQFMQKLSGHILVLTANQRLAAHLRDEYDQFQLTLSRQLWPSLNILPLVTWVNATLENQIYFPNILLNHAQELALWQTLIAKSAPSSGSYALAKLAQQAYALLKQWNLKLTQINHSHNSDVMAFYQWASEFEQICATQSLLDPNSSITQLITYLENSLIKLPDHIIIVGFQDITPQTEKLFQLCTQKTQLHTWDYPLTENSIRKIGLENLDEEIKTMAQWTRQILKTHPEAKIGCVIPELTQLRDQVEKIFTQVWAPEAHFNISAGYSFSSLPIIQAALSILEFDQEIIPLSLISELLRSPFLGGAEQEMAARARLDSELHELNEYSIYFKSILAFARELKQTPLLVQNLLEFQNQSIMKRQLHKEKYELSFWIELFSHQLKSMGWPGQRNLTTEEYQAVERWQQALIEFQSLNLVLPAMNHAEALFHCKNFLANIIFQPENAQAAVQLLGQFEAIGLEFDYLWVMGLNNTRFPANPSPHPFIPIALQRRLHMPSSSAERELIFCQQLLAGYIKHNKNLVLSFAKHEDDRIAHPSPLIDSFVEISIDDLNLTTEISSPVDLAEMEYYEDVKAPPVTATESIKGGSYIFKAQAACPFRAFAEIRLGAQTINRISPGLNALERGSLLHEVLAKIWQTIKTQEKLCQLSTAELEKIISNCIQNSLVEMIKIRPLTLKKRFAAIEQQRLTQLILQWLDFEKKRPNFRVISQEQSRHTQLGGIDLNLQIDRIDEVADGSHIIIDYKTGRTSIQDWLDERPNEPQLPLYCVSSEQSVKAVLFAQVRPDEMGFKGITATDLGIKGSIAINDMADEDLPTTWQELVELWHHVLENLAKEFNAGMAQVAPKNPMTCQQCELDMLCRIHEEADQ